MAGRRDSNLFSIDHDAIVAVLEDANRRLVERSKQLVAALERVPDTLASAEDVGKAEVFLRQLNDAIGECRAARLSDGRPFNAAAKTVKTFFEEIDTPLKAALGVIRRRLTDAALRSRAAAEPAAGPVPIGNDIGGNDIVTTSPTGAETGIRTVLDWEIDGFDRRLLDLEALRPFLTDSALLTACSRHLAQHGPNRLGGVSYREVFPRR